MASFDHELAHCAAFQPLVVAVGGPELSVCGYLLTSLPSWELLGGTLGTTGRLRWVGGGSSLPCREKHFLTDAI